MFRLKVESGPSTQKLKFKSNLLGSLGAGLNVKPNLIDFSTVFDNFAQKLLDNIAVVVTVIGIIVAYIPLLVCLRRLDLTDLVRVSDLDYVDFIKIYLVDLGHFNIFLKFCSGNVWDCSAMMILIPMSMKFTCLRELYVAQRQLRKCLLFSLALKTTLTAESYMPINIR